MTVLWALNRTKFSSLQLSYSPSQHSDRRCSVVEPMTVVAVEPLVVLIVEQIAMLSARPATAPVVGP